MINPNSKAIIVVIYHYQLIVTAFATESYVPENVTLSLILCGPIYVFPFYQSLLISYNCNFH